MYNTNTKQCLSESGTKLPQEHSVFLVIFHAWQMYLLLSQEEKEEDVPVDAEVHGRLDGWTMKTQGKGNMWEFQTGGS